MTRLSRTAVDTRLAHAHEWNGIKHGDPVKVDGFGGNFKFEFVSHVTNTETGDSWVEVVGGRVRGKKEFGRGMRSFDPARVTRSRAKTSNRRTEDE